METVNIKLFQIKLVYILLFVIITLDFDVRNINLFSNEIAKKSIITYGYTYTHFSRNR